MKKSPLILFTAITLISGNYVKAQELHPNTITNGIVEIINDNSAQPETVYNTLIENAPIVPEYPNLPRFAIVGKENKFYLSIGATIKATAVFDWGNPLNDPALFMPSNFTRVSPGNGGDFQFTAKRSKIHFNFVALPGTQNQIGIYLSMKFTGSNNNYGAALDHAYLKFRGFTVGYKNTLYADGAACPYTIDAEGPNSQPGIWNTCLDYEHSFNHKISIGAGLELPLYSVTGTNNSLYPERLLGDLDIIGKANSVNQRIPDVPMYVQYSFGNKGHIRATGIIRTLTYRDINMDKNKNKIGWGAKLSGYYNMCPFATLYWMGQYGKGIASYMQDNYGLGLDMVPSNEIPGELQLTKGWGAFLGLQFNWSKKVFSTLLYSHLRNYMDAYNGGNSPFNDQYQWGQYACSNIVYSINPFVQLGIEYLYGRRMSFDKTQIHDNRLEGMLQVTF